MPIYEFRCRECDKVWEMLLRTVDNLKIRCPSCGNTNMEKLVSASHVIKTNSSSPGTTCCGREERCDTPSCSTGESCHRG